MNTLSEMVTIKGIGIHSGEDVVMQVIPMDEAGIVFEYQSERVVVSLESISSKHVRSTALTNGTVTIFTPEHFLAACYALSLTNICIRLSSTELPILDGSSIEFIQQLQPRLVSIDNERLALTITDHVYFEYQNSTYTVMPSDQFIVRARISYPDHWVQSMSFSYNHSLNQFIQDIAPARTYGFTHELEYLKKNNLAKGGSLDNALVVTDDGYMNEPRFDDEMVRHKVLDFIGDMSLSNQQMVGEFIIDCPSHAGNCQFIQYLNR